MRESQELPPWPQEIACLLCELVGKVQIVFCQRVIPTDNMGLIVFLRAGIMES